MEPEISTEFHYLYRDAGNFKVFGSVILKGRLDEKARATIINSMDEDGRFVAEQVGIPPLYEPLHQLTNGPSKADVCTHEFCHFEELPTASQPMNAVLWGESDHLVAAFERVRVWAMKLSPNAEQFGIVATTR